MKFVILLFILFAVVISIAAIIDIFSDPVYNRYLGRFVSIERTVGSFLDPDIVIIKTDIGTVQINMRNCPTYIAADDSLFLYTWRRRKLIRTRRVK